MKNFARFLIPLGLGAFAFVLNWMAVQPQLGRQFVVVKETALANQPLEEEQLEAFKIVGEDFERLKKTIVPWEERASLIGTPLRRKLEPGDFVFWQDVRFVAADFLPAPDEYPLHISLDGINYEPSLLKVGNQVGLIVPVASEKPAASTGDDPSANDLLSAQLNAKFEELGPFRILSVGQRTLAAPGDSDLPADSQGDARFITLAIKMDSAVAPVASVGAAPSSSVVSPSTAAAPAGRSGKLPEAARKLLAAQSIERSNGRNIVAMVLYQDVERLSRLRDAKAAADAKPAATPSATGAGS